MQKEVREGKTFPFSFSCIVNFNLRIINEDMKLMEMDYNYILFNVMFNKGGFSSLSDSLGCQTHELLTSFEQLYTG